MLLEFFLSFYLIPVLLPKLSHPHQEAHQDQVPAASLQLDSTETKPDQWHCLQ